MWEDEATPNAKWPFLFVRGKVGYMKTWVKCLFLTLLATIPVQACTSSGAVAEFHDLRSLESITVATTAQIVDASATRQYVGDCAALLVLDEAAFDAVCGEAPTILSHFIDAIDAPVVSADAGSERGRGPPGGDDAAGVGGSEMSTGGGEATLMRPPRSLDVLKNRLDTLTRRGFVPGGFTHTANTGNLENLGQHRARMVESLTRRIETASREYAEAAYEGNLRGMVKVEAWLSQIRERLWMSSGPLPAALEDPYALMSDSALRAGIVEVSRVDLILADSLILFPGDPALSVARQSTDEILTRLRRANGVPSVERDRDTARLLRGLDAEQISAIRPAAEAALPAAERSAMDIARQRFRAVGTRLDDWRGPRGPPSDPSFPRSARLLDATKQIFANPARFVRGMSSLRAEHGEFYSALPAGLRERWSFGADDYYRWIAAQMSGGRPRQASLHDSQCQTGRGDAGRMDRIRRRTR